MVTARLLVGLTNVDELLFAGVDAQGLFEEQSHWVLLVLSSTAVESPFLRDLLTEPDRVGDAIFPIVCLEHHSSDFFLLRLLSDRLGLLVLALVFTIHRHVWLLIMLWVRDTLCVSLLSLDGFVVFALLVVFFVLYFFVLHFNLLAWAFDLGFASWFIDN